MNKTSNSIDIITQNAEKAGLLIPLEGVNQWVLPKRTTKLITGLKKLFTNKIAEENNFEEWIFPRIIPERILLKTGWLNFHRSEAFLINPKREYQYTPIDIRGNPFNISEDTTGFKICEIAYTLDPIQCVSFYYSLFKNKIPLNQLPIKVFEHQGGWTWRNETELKGFYKTIEFLRIEFVYMGLYSHVIEIRKNLISCFSNCIKKILDLPLFFAEGESCFVEPTKANNYEHNNYEYIDKTEDFQTIDLIIKRLDGSFSEVGSISRYSDIPSNFAIEITGKADQLWSGCMGIGLNRILICIWEKYGLDENSWPVKIKNAIQIS